MQLSRQRRLLLALAPFVFAGLLAFMPVLAGLSPPPEALTLTILLDLLLFLVAVWIVAAAVYLRHDSDSRYRSGEKYLRTILDNAVDGLITINERGSIRSFNHACETIFGYEVAEVIGRNISMLMPEPYRSGHDGYLRNYRDTGVRKIIGMGREVAGRRKNGAVFPLELSVAEVTVDGQKLYSGVVRDVTARRKMESALQEAKERAERATQSKSVFLANISHELRTPLNSIIGMVELILKDAGLGAENREMAEVVQKSSVSLLEIVNDLLDISKIETGNVTLENIGFDFMETVSHCVETLAPLAAARGLSVHYGHDGPALPYVKGDPARTGRIVLNLIGNAVKYTEKGSVRIEVSHAPREDGRIDLSCRVSDTGIGIAADKLDVIFEKFTQADETITRKYGGTGLGLAITRDLVDMMGGTIGVESEIGKGSVFWFRIPFGVSDKIETGRKKDSGASIRQEFTGEKVAAGSARILVAEDHLLNRTFLKKLLGRMGFTTLVFKENGRLALDACAEEGFDLILMDCHMPEMNGYEAAAALRLREEGTGRRTPVIAMTADAMAGTREKCFEAGMDAYINKPIDSGAFRALLEQWIVFPGDADGGSAGHPPADLSALREYVDGAEEMAQYVNIFLTQTEQDMKTLEQHCTGGESHLLWTETAHRMKGGAGMMGAAQLQQLCARAQLMASATLADRTALLEEIRAAFGDVKKFINAAAA